MYFACQATTEEATEQEYIMTKEEEEETLLRSFFGQDISDEKLKWLMCGRTYEYTEKPAEEPQETEIPEEEIRYLNDIIENKRRTVMFEK